MMTDKEVEDAIRALRQDVDGLTRRVDTQAEISRNFNAGSGSSFAKKLDDIDAKLTYLGAIKERTIVLVWEQNEYKVSSDKDGSLTLLGFLEQIGDGRGDIIDILMCNFMRELEAKFQRMSPYRAHPFDPPRPTGRPKG